VVTKAVMLVNLNPLLANPVLAATTYYYNSSSEGHTHVAIHHPAQGSLLKTKECYGQLAGDNYY